jgi:Cas6b C-terminal domain/Cas6b N-terminal domain
MQSLAVEQLELTDYHLRLARPLAPAEATQLRGYFGNAFADELLVHHHQTDGRLLYDYPRVQFKVLDRAAHLLGINEGGPIVERLWRETDVARIRHEELPILEATLVKRREAFGETEDPLGYQFRSPWLALNQENHRQFEDCAERGQQLLLERVMIGNCLSLAKSFGHRVELRLKADGKGLRRTLTRLKGVPMLAFWGTFRVNFSLPAWIGIGKSVSRGFGTVEPLVANEQA